MKVADASRHLEAAAIAVDAAVAALTTAGSCPALEAEWMRLCECAAVSREWVGFVFRCWVELQLRDASSPMGYPVLPGGADQAARWARQCSRLALYPRPSLLRTLARSLGGSGAAPGAAPGAAAAPAAALETSVLSLFFAVALHRRLLGSVVDLRVGREGLDSLALKVSSWIALKAPVEIDDAACRDFRARVYAQALLPGERYAAAPKHPIHPGLVQLGVAGVVEAEIVSRVQADGVGARLAVMLSQPPASLLAPAPAEPTEAPVVPVIPDAVLAAARDMAALTVFDLHFRVATNAGFAREVVLLSDHTVLQRAAVEGGIRPRNPLVASVLVEGPLGPRVVYCVLEGARVVRVGGRPTHSLEEAIALWLLVVEREHGNELSCGRPLAGFRAELALL